jgi:hypothetical protein
MVEAWAKAIRPRRTGAVEDGNRSDDLGGGDKRDEVRIINDRSPGVEGREVEHLARGTGSPQHVVVEGMEHLRLRAMRDDEDFTVVQAADLILTVPL